MKKLYMMFLLVPFAACSPEEIEEKQQENLIIQAMTNGQWKVTSFKKGSTDITTDFSAYRFQFKSNFTVDAISNGSLEKTGAWNADAAAQTITSSFTNVTNPLELLNGTWSITATTWTSVQANQTVASETRTLRLDKL